MPTPSVRSIINITSVIASTGVASRITIDVAYIAQTKSGSRYHVSPGARMRCVVTMKLSPVRIDEKPAMNAANVVPKTCVFEYCVENGV